jgi:WD40 repeat protein
LAGDESGKLKLWDVTTGSPIWNVNADHVISVAFSPNGRAVLSGSANRTLTLRDLRTGRPIRTFTGHSWPVTSVAFSSDGNFVLSGAFDDPDLSGTGETPGRGRGEVKLWDVATGTVIHTFTEHSGSVKSVAFSPDDRLVLAGDDNVMTLWDRASGHLIHTFSGNSMAVESVAFSPEDRLILAGSSDHIVTLWDTIAGRPIRTFAEHSFPVSSVTISPDGSLALSGGFDSESVDGHGGGDLKLWEVGYRAKQEFG